MKKQIGVVGVDSAHLMIIDPCYIRDSIIPMLEGKEQHFTFWGKDQRRTAILLQNEGWTIDEGECESVIRNVTNEQVERLEKRINRLIKEKGYLVVTRIITGNFEDKIFDLLSGESSAGQLNFRQGHPGLAVAFQSGFGDGLYPVYAHYSGGTITKVEIVFVTK